MDQALGRAPLKRCSPRSSSTRRRDVRLAARLSTMIRRILDHRTRVRPARCRPRFAYVRQLLGDPVSTRRIADRHTRRVGNSSSRFHESGRHSLSRSGFSSTARIGASAARAAFMIPMPDFASRKTWSRLTPSPVRPPRRSGCFNLYPAATGDDWIEFDCVINVRPSQDNRSRSVEDENIRTAIRRVVRELVADP